MKNKPHSRLCNRGGKPQPDPVDELDLVRQIRQRIFVDKAPLWKVEAEFRRFVTPERIRQIRCYEVFPDVVDVPMYHVNFG